MALWSLGPLLCPIIGPVAGGFLVEVKGWRWVFWVITILVSFVLLKVHHESEAFLVVWFYHHSCYFLLARDLCTGHP